MYVACHGQYDGAFEGYIMSTLVHVGAYSSWIKISRLGDYLKRTLNPLNYASARRLTILLAPGGIFGPKSSVSICIINNICKNNQNG